MVYRFPRHPSGYQLGIADRENRKIGADLDLGADSLIFTSADATKWVFTIADDGSPAVDEVDGDGGWTPSGGGAVDVVSNVATSTILGRTTAGSGDSEELTASAVRELLNVEDGATADQTGAEMATALDTEIGSSTWRKPGLDRSYAFVSEAGTTALSSSAATVDFDTVRLKTADWTLSGGELTYTGADTAVFHISTSVMFSRPDASSPGRGEGIAVMEQHDGATYSEVSRGITYTRFATNIKGVATAIGIVSMDTNDKIRVRAYFTADDGDTIADGSNIVAVRIA
jgi:hypothetical protein